jgi:hypothetical protein
MKKETITHLQEKGYIDMEGNVTPIYRLNERNIDWENDCERVKLLDTLLNILLGKKASEEFKDKCSQTLDEIAVYHNYQLGFETGDRLRHISLILAEEKIDSVLRQDYSYDPKFKSKINLDAKQPIRNLVSIADSSLHPIERKSQSIEEWAQDLVSAYRGSPNRPDNLVVLLQRFGECYLGAVYLPRNHFDGGNSG